MARDMPTRWIIKNDEKQFFANVAKYVAESNADLAVKSKARTSRITKAPLRCCVGLFAAADVLGLGFVRGVPPHLYLQRLDLDVLQKLGLSVESRRADVYIRIPFARLLYATACRCPTCCRSGLTLQRIPPGGEGRRI
jgi:hypothetical protein